MTVRCKEKKAFQSRQCIENLIDRTDFKTVRAYYRWDSEIQYLLMAAKGCLSHVAKILANASNDSYTQILNQLIQQCLVKIGICDNTIINTQDLESIARVFFKLDEIPNEAICQVVYLPPVYVIEFEE